MGFRMRRLATPLVVILVALVLGTAPADAESSTALNRDVSGPFVGTTFFDFFTNGCSFIHQALDGTYATAKGGSGFFHLDVCPTFGVDNGSVDVGTFSLHDPLGSTLDGTVTGVYDTTVPTSIRFEFTLRVVSGTRRFRHAHGTVTLTGTWEFVSITSPIFGTLVGSLKP